MNRCPECGGKMTLDEFGEHCEICEPEIESRSNDLIDDVDDFELPEEDEKPTFEPVKERKGKNEK